MPDIFTVEMVSSYLRMGFIDDWTFRKFTAIIEKMTKNGVTLEMRIAQEYFNTVMVAVYNGNVVSFREYFHQDKQGVFNAIDYIYKSLAWLKD